MQSQSITPVKRLRSPSPPPSRSPSPSPPSSPPPPRLYPRLSPATPAPPSRSPSPSPPSSPPPRRLSPPSPPPRLSAAAAAAAAAPSPPPIAAAALSTPPPPRLSAAAAATAPPSPPPPPPPIAALNTATAPPSPPPSLPATPALSTPPPFPAPGATPGAAKSNVNNLSPPSTTTPTTPTEYFYVTSDPQGIQPDAACTIVLNDSNQMKKSNGGKDISSGPFIEAKVGQCDATKCTVVETMNDGTAGRTFTNTGASIAFMFKREPASDLPTVAVSPAVVPAANQDADNQDAANQYDANQDADAVQDASEEGGGGGELEKGGGEGELEEGGGDDGDEQQQSPLPSPSPSSNSPPPNSSPPKPLDPGVSCGATLPLDDLPDSCSSDAPPPPLKAYLLSILSPILEEYADALFQTLRVKPLQLTESVVSDAVMSQAITPEVLERMKALNDPAVQKVLDDFKANVRKAVQQSGEMLQNGLGDNIGNLLGNVVRKFTDSIKFVVADIPGVGGAMALVNAGSAVVDAAEQAKVIEGEVLEALKPLNAVQAQVGKVTAAVDEATKNLPLGPGQEGDIEMTRLGPNAVDEESESGEAANPSAAAGAATESGEAASPSAASPSAASPSAASPSAASPSAAPILSTTEKGADGTIEMTELPSPRAAQSRANPGAAQSGAAQSAAAQSAAAESAASPSGAAESAASPSAPALGNRKTPARQVGPQDAIFARPLLSKNKKENDAMDEETSGLGGGGSRKRRRIHKLSRRIERTLRRVQKKYGLQSNQSNQGNQGNQSNQDKNGFLRRTLRHRKP